MHLTTRCRRNTSHSTICFFMYPGDTIPRSYCLWARQCRKKKVSCCETVFVCLCYFHPCFLCELTGKHGFAASPEMLNLDMRKTNSICLLSKKTPTESSAVANTSHVQDEQKATRCLYRTVIPYMRRFKRIHVKLTLLILSAYISERGTRAGPRWAFLW